MTRYFQQNSCRISYRFYWKIGNFSNFLAGALTKILGIKIDFKMLRPWVEYLEIQDISSLSPRSKEFSLQNIDSLSGHGFRYLFTYKIKPDILFLDPSTKTESYATVLLSQDGLILAELLYNWHSMEGAADTEVKITVLRTRYTTEPCLATTNSPLPSVSDTPWMDGVQLPRETSTSLLEIHRRRIQAERRKPLPWQEAEVVKALIDINNRDLLHGIRLGIYEEISEADLQKAKLEFLMKQTPPPAS